MRIGEVQAYSKSAGGHLDYTCGGCGKPVHGKVVAKASFESDDRVADGEIYWLLCPCGQPTVIQQHRRPSPMNVQSPMPRAYAQNPKWPAELGRLFDEAAGSFSAGAYTAAAMVCRKILMAVACQEGDAEGRTFAQYVDYLLANVVQIPSTRDAIDRIRQIGNEANHHIAFVQEPEAREAMEIAVYVLDTVYSLCRR